EPLEPVERPRAESRHESGIATHASTPRAVCHAVDRGGRPRRGPRPRGLLPELPGRVVRDAAAHGDLPRGPSLRRPARRCVDGGEGTLARARAADAEGTPAPRESRAPFKGRTDRLRDPS